MHEHSTKNVCFLRSFKTFIDDVHCIPPLKKVGVYHGFAGEASTRTVIEYLWEKGIQVFLPKMLSVDDMTFIPYTKYTKLLKNNFGFLEPSIDPLGNNPDLELMLMPLLAFDDHGARLGFGKGHYDRYLGELREKNSPIPFKMGLAFEYQRAESIPIEDHDEKLDAVLLPHSYIHFPPTNNTTM